MDPSKLAMEFLVSLGKPLSPGDMVAATAREFTEGEIPSERRFANACSRLVDAGLLDKVRDGNTVKFVLAVQRTSKVRESFRTYANMLSVEIRELKRRLDNDQDSDVSILIGGELVEGSPERCLEILQCRAASAARFTKELR